MSFAFGGAGTEYQNGIPASTATVPGVLGQVKMYTDALGPKRAPADALYVVWAGGNDYAFLGRQDPPGVVGNIAQAVRQLPRARAASCCPTCPTWASRRWPNRKGRPPRRA